MKVCLVTGGAGFIGSHLVEALVARQSQVRVLDDFSTGRQENLATVRDRVEIIRGDVADLELLRVAVRGVQVIFHQAALASVPRSIADPVATHLACATGTLNVLVAAREAGINRVVYASSSSAYGSTTRRINRESDPPQPLSPYAAAKLAGEHYCRVFHEVYGLETVCLRYFNVFGPRQPPDSPYSAVIPLFLDAMLAGRSPTVHGDGQQSRDFTYVDNVVLANLLAAEKDGVGGQVYNIACGQSVSLLDLVALMNQLLGTSLQPIHDAPRPGDVRHSQADVTRARTELGFIPPIDLQEGLRRSLGFYRKEVRD
jgi:UDP-glucose 4-epimerase